VTTDIRVEKEDCSVQNNEDIKKEAYEKAYQEGYEKGFIEGRKVGYKQGYDNCKLAMTKMDMSDALFDCM
jgi:flagellar biosynthesis/type III secretory pathway protein FliH